MRIIQVTEEHIHAISETEQQSFSDAWTENALASALSDQLGIFLAAEENGVITGYIIGSCDGYDGYIEKVAVSPAYRRRGIGTILLDGFEAALPGTVAAIALEVRVSNEAAINLYSGHGYTHAGIRKGFYSSPKEDGAVMIKNLHS